MSANVGTIDRTLRALLGLVLLWLAFFSGAAFVAGSVVKAIVIIAGLVMLATAAFRWCPLYRLLRVSTCRVG